MLKKIISLVSIPVVLGCSLSVSAADNEVDWKSLYKNKMEEINEAYANGTKDNAGFGKWENGFFPEYMGVSYFSVQDINFDGVPELYHALCWMFELEPFVKANEEIYYIKDGEVLQGTIEDGADFCLLPKYSGMKAESGDVYDARWQYAMRSRENGEVCFVTNDSYSGFMDFPSITYSKLYFDSASGVLSSDVLLHLDDESYTEPVYLQGYDYVGADCYTSLSSDGWGIDDWKPGYLAPVVKIAGNKVEFDVQPQIIKDRTMVPLRAIFEKLGAEVSWDDTTKTVTALKDDVTIKMTIGADSFMRNSEVIALDSPATIISERTLVPVRAIAESFGLTVTWDSATKTVNIEESTENAEQVPTEEVKVEEASETTVQAPADEVKMDEATVKGLLSGQISFIEFDTKQEATINNLSQVNSRYAGIPKRYAIVDLNRDGIDELIVEHSPFGDHAIITAKDGGFVAYYISYRGIKCLKKDGSMEWSNGAAESGAGKISAFTDNGIEYVYTIYYSEPEFKIDGVSVSEDEVIAALKAQLAKEDAEYLSIE